MLLEYACLKAFWATPGKFLLGMKIVPDGMPKEHVKLFIRCVQVWFYGIALGLPLVTLATQVTAGTRIEFTGDASWDVACGTQVVSTHGAA